MRPIATDVARHEKQSVYLSVCMSVCSCVGITRMCCTITAKQIEMLLVKLTHMGQGNHVLDGGQDHMGWSNSGGCAAHWKALGVGVCSKRGHSILSIADCNTRCHVTLSPVKNPPPCDAAFRRNSLTTCYISSAPSCYDYWRFVFVMLLESSLF